MTKLVAIMFILGSGCDGLLPITHITEDTNQSQGSQDVTIKVVVDGEGRISVGGAGSVDVRSEKAGSGCVCGCSVPGCQCSGPQLGKPADEIRIEKPQPQVPKPPQHIDVYTLANGRCAACEMLAADLQSRGISVRLVRDTQGRYSQYPTAVSEGREPYQPPEGFNGATTSDEVIRRLLK